MDIRTKLALALVSVSLASMLALGAFAYRTTFELLREGSEQRLDALAETKQRDLERLVQGWRDRVLLIRSRTRLRMLLAAYSERRDEIAPPELRRILADALASVPSVERVTLFDRHRDPVTSVGSAGLPVELDANVFDDPDAVIYGGTYRAAGDRIHVRFSAALVREGVVVGAMETIIDAEDLLSVAQDYTGLGETGESLLFMAAPEGQVSVLSPLRHEPDLRLLPLDSSVYLVAALEGREEVFRSGVRDYRGADVWCVTRALPEVGWGLVVKIDSAEEAQRADWLRGEMLDVGFALGAIAILGGTLLGSRLGRPLRNLKADVERIRGGERELRLIVTTEDEVRFLADALNDILDEQRRRE